MLGACEACGCPLRINVSQCRVHVRFNCFLLVDWKLTCPGDSSYLFIYSWLGDLNACRMALWAGECLCLSQGPGPSNRLLRNICFYILYGGYFPIELLSFRPFIILLVSRRPCDGDALVKIAPHQMRHTSLPCFGGGTLGSPLRIPPLGPRLGSPFPMLPMGPHPSPPLPRRGRQQRKGILRGALNPCLASEEGAYLKR